MRKLKLQVQISVDGFIADINGKTDWMVWNWGPKWNWDDELQKYFNELTTTVDTVLLSRKMAVEGFIDHWASAAAKTGDPQAGFAKVITNATKVVFTKTLKEPTWPNTTLVKGDLVKEVNKLKAQEGKDIIVYGGASFVSSLIKAGLIDELHLFVNPTILGEGMPIFKEAGGTEFQLVNALPYKCGVTVLAYTLKGK